VASTPGGIIFLNLSGMAAEKLAAATAWYLKIKKNQAIRTTA
jgi:hypothetical protein